MFDEDEDEVTIYGTPLPPLEDNENASKKPELDLTVRDWKGRRRFHGAFTGGFSAGYYNTVGTEKGWIPSQYISKKGDRWDKDLVSSKPEDFMDEEDFSLFGIAPKKVHTKDDFKGPEPEAFAGLRDPNVSLVDVLRDIIKPTTQSIGVRLFMMMKKGRRYKGAFTKPKTNTKVYGCSMPPQYAMSKDDDENDCDSESVLRPELFSLPYTPKSDFHGIGYKSLKPVVQEEEEKATPLTAVLSGNKRLKITGEAFGYGALEGEDDDYADDAMIYSKVDLSKYDFEIGSVKKSDHKASTSAHPSARKGVLEGFTLSIRIEPIQSSRNRLPDIPRHWRPHPPFLKHKRVSRWGQTSSSNDNKNSISTDLTQPPLKPTESQVTAPMNRPKPLNSHTRAVLLGEEVDIVVGIKRQSETDPSTSTEEAETKKLETEKPSEPSRPLSTFFASRFVQSSEHEDDKLKPGLMEAKSIPNYKPKSEQGDDQNVESRVGKSKRETFQWHPHTLLCKRFNVPHPYPQFPDVIGVLNFNRDPAPKEMKKAPSSSKPNIFSSLLASPIPSIPSSLKSSEPKPIPLQSATVTKEKVLEQSPEKTERPPLDLFKAIFASDESATDEEEEEEDKEKSKDKDTSESTLSFLSPDKTKPEPKEVDNQTTHFISKDQVVQPKPSTSRAGIFSGLDFDLINKRISYALPTKVHDDSENEVIIESQVSGQDKEGQVTIEDSYGPALPPPDLDTSYASRSSHKKKEKKRRKSKSKSKNKRKLKKSKHRRRSESDSYESNSSDSDDADEIHSKRHKSYHSKRSS